MIGGVSFRPFAVLTLAAGLAGVTPTTNAADGKVIELILDASGSMNAKLPSGETRIAAARVAVKEVLNSLPPGVRLAFRAYGHQYPTAKKECNDTQLLVPFGPAEQVKARVIEQSQRIEARGYTPITNVLEVATSDFGGDATGERAIILVSDGKETCAGDPCATARALKAANTGLVVHTIGFDVDLAARLQLSCVAQSTGGKYYDAADAKALVQALGAAAIATMTKVTIQADKPGNLTIKKPDYDHQVTNPVSGEAVAAISSVRPSVLVPAGVYNVMFGDVAWKSVVVEAGKETVLTPGVLEVLNAGFDGHTIRDSETGLVHGSVSSVKTRMTLIPGTFDVTFGPLVWPQVRVDGGNVVTLNPGVIRIAGGTLKDSGTVYTPGGQKVGEMVLGRWSLPVPAGDYLVEVAGEQTPVKVAEGQIVQFDLKK